MKNRKIYDNMCRWQLDSHTTHTAGFLRSLEPTGQVIAGHDMTAEATVGLPVDGH